MPMPMANAAAIATVTRVCRASTVSAPMQKAANAIVTVTAAVPSAL